MVQAWLYRKIEGEILYLLLKRTVENGGFWQPVVGKIEITDANEQAAALREIEEETAIPRSKVKCTHTHIHDFTMDKNYLTNTPIALVHEIVLAYESFTFDCVIDGNKDAEHECFGWFTFDQAMNLLKWKDNKDALQKLYSFLQCS